MKWEKTVFSALVNFSPKISLEKDELYDNIPMDIVDGGNKYIQVTNQRIYTGSGAKFENGDTIFARITPCLENGKIAKIKELEKGVGFGSTEFFVFRAKDNISDPDFIYYLAKTDMVRQPAIKSMVGASGRQRADKGVVEKIVVPNIPLPTQRKIASILSAYDDLIENNLKRMKLLEEKALVKYRQIACSEKMKELLINELADVVMGQSPSSNTYTDEQSENLPFHQGVTNFSNYFVEHKTYCTAPIKIAEADDILFSVRAPVGRINFTNEKICIGRGLCAFRSKTGFQNYFYHQLKEFFFADDIIGNGTIFNAVTKAELMKLKLKTPFYKIQKQFEFEARIVYDLILNLTKQNAKLREARDILLPRLMNGQIEV